MQEGQETQKEEDGTMQEMAEQHDLEATGETAEPQEPHAADEAQEDFMEALNATAQEQEGEEAARERGRNRNIDRAGSCPKTLLLAADGFGCGGVGENRGVNAFATFTCKLSKMVHVVTMPYNDSSAEVVARLFMDAVWRLHGPPCMKIVCDRDPRFRDAMTQEFMRLMGVKVASTTSYHPQSDGQAERSNHTVERMLRCCVAENQEDWDLWPKALSAYCP
eukprot:gene34335-biopygen26067